MVSLDELDARPIKKGKRHPRCEFGSTNQMTFNRQGFMITLETLIGKPDKKKLAGGQDRPGETPKTAPKETSLAS